MLITGVVLGLILFHLSYGTGLLTPIPAALFGEGAGPAGGRGPRACDGFAASVGPVGALEVR